MMKWDVKHDLAKQAIDGYLEKAKAELAENNTVAGLSDEDKAIVSEELAVMIESIRKRYKLQERLPEAKVEHEMVPMPGTEKLEELKAEVEAETKTEEKPAEKPAKPKRTGKKAESTGEKKERKPRVKKEKEVVA